MDERPPGASWDPPDTLCRASCRAFPDRLIVVVVGHAHLLGKGRLVARVGLPSLAVGARMSQRLTTAYLEASVATRRPL